MVLLLIIRATEAREGRGEDQGIPTTLKAYLEALVHSKVTSTVGVGRFGNSNGADAVAFKTLSI